GAAAAGEADRGRLDTAKRSDERRQRGHRAARGAARNGGDRVTLVGAGALVGEEADRPVALPHRLRRQPEDDETETVERDGAVLAALDLKRHREGARPFA